jgi:hypothetical protein
VSFSTATGDCTNLALIAEAGETETVDIQLTNAMWSGSSLQLQLTVIVFDSTEESWEIRCGDVLAYVLRNDGTNRLQLTEDHPLLWEFKHENASAYFNRAPINAEAAVGAL